MQYRPTTAELLAAVADLLETDVLAAVPADLQHKVRVAANLARVLEREARLEADSLAHERELLTELLGHAGPVDDLRDELARRLRAGSDETFERAAWTALVAVARDDLAIAKPGHDQWEGE